MGIHRVQGGFPPGLGGPWVIQVTNRMIASMVIPESACGP